MGSPQISLPIRSWRRSPSMPTWYPLTGGPTPNYTPAAAISPNYPNKGSMDFVKYRSMFGAAVSPIQTSTKIAVKMHMQQPSASWVLPNQEKDGRHV